LKRCGLCHILDNTLYHPNLPEVISSYTNIHLEEPATDTPAKNAIHVAVLGTDIVHHVAIF
jgi:hypothetical protein